MVDVLAPATQLVVARLHGKVAVVTGAAYGIGRATAERLAREGAAVALLDLKGDVASQVASQLPCAIAITVDVTDAVAVEKAMASTVNAFGGIDILVNNAGGAIIPPQPFWEMTEAEWDFLQSLNLKSQWLCVKAVLPSMRSRGQGRIINITSVGGIGGWSGLCAYTAAKGGVIAMTKTMARELGAFGINVNAIAPGQTRHTYPKTVANEEQVRELERVGREQTVLKRNGEPEDIAATVAFLASSDAVQVTGQVIPVDGFLVA